MGKFLINQIVRYNYYDKSMFGYEAKRIIEEVSYELIDKE